MVDKCLDCSFCMYTPSGLSNPNIYWVLLSVNCSWDSFVYLLVEQTPHHIKDSTFSPNFPINYLRYSIHIRTAENVLQFPLYIIYIYKTSLLSNYHGISCCYWKNLTMRLWQKIKGIVWGLSWQIHMIILIRSTVSQTLARF